VPLNTYDESLSVLRRALDSAKLGNSDKTEGFERLDRFLRRMEEGCLTTCDETDGAREETTFPILIAQELSLKKAIRVLAGRSMLRGWRPFLLLDIGDEARRNRASRLCVFAERCGREGAERFG
jgi:hypothetical protein